MVESLARAVSLRPTRLHELDAVVDILNSTADWYRPFTDPKDLKTQHEVDMVWARENMQKREFWSAKLDDDVVGVLTLQDAGDAMYLGYVYVHENHVGKRIGRRLLDHAAAESRKRGKRGMVLIAHPEATWAIRAYRKYGFECIAASEADVLAWNDGWLKPYYEKGFQLWRHSLEA